MILGIGIDIVSTNRMRALIEERGQVFVERTFTAGERKIAASRHDPVLYYCTRLAAKEAVFKSLGASHESDRDPRDVEILNDPSGAPYAVLCGRTQAIAVECGVSTIHISISDEDDYVIAFATAEGRS
jgi:holo-[acyl-carrier protein] synthase